MFSWRRSRSETPAIDQPQPVVDARALAGRTFAPAPEVVAARQDGRNTLLDLKRDRYIGLDETGTRIWEMLVAGLTFDQIVNCMEAEYAESRERIEADTARFLTMLADRGLVVMS
jgi:hypothetical protein